MSSKANLESQAAQLLIQLHVTNNPAFRDVDGFHDEELLMRADALGVASRDRADAKRRSNELLQLSNASVASDASDEVLSSSGMGDASFEVEQFRAALRQQRAPSLRLLAAVSRNSIPAIM